MSYIFPHQPPPHNPEIPYPGEELPTLSRPVRDQHIVNSFHGSPQPIPVPVPVRGTPPIQIPTGRHRSSSQATPVDPYGRNSYGKSPSILSAARSPPAKQHHHHNTHTCGRNTASPVYFEPSSSYDSPSQLKNQFRHLEHAPRQRHSSFGSSDGEHDGHIDAYYRRSTSRDSDEDRHHQHQQGPRHSRHDTHHHHHQSHKPSRPRKTSVSDDMMRPGLPRHHSTSSYNEYPRRAGSTTPDSYSYHSESRYQSQQQPQFQHAMSLPPQPQMSHNYGPLPPQLHQSTGNTMLPGADIGAMTVGGTPLPAHDYATFAAVSGNNVRALPYASPHYPAGPGGQVGYPNAMPLTSTIDMPPPAGHYGAPRHPSVKPDYRRFCFSVGKADVPYSSLSVAPPPLGVGIPR